jgi:hypothetical protein
MAGGSASTAAACVQASLRHVMPAHTLLSAVLRHMMYGLWPLCAGSLVACTYGDLGVVQSSAWA